MLPFPVIWNANNLGSSGGGGGSGNSFTIIQCDAGSNPEADSATDTLTLTSSVLDITGSSVADSVTFGIKAGAITNTMVSASAAIDFSKLAALASGNILVGNGSNVAVSVAVTGDVTITNAGVTAIASGVIVNADINASAAIAFSKLAALTNGNILVGNGSNVATSVAVTGDVTITNAGVTAIASGVIVNADINASAAIAFSKLAALTSTNILVGNGSNVATAVAMSGDATLANTGALTIATGAVTYAKMQTFGANTFIANNTGSAAAPSEKTFKDMTAQTISSTITWTGTTAPSGTANHQYTWEQVGNDVHVWLSLKYATPGTSVSVVAIEFPSDLPAPLEISGSTAASERLINGAGEVEATNTGSAGAARSWIRRNAGDTAYEFVCQAGASNAAFAKINISYRTA